MNEIVICSHMLVNNRLSFASDARATNYMGPRMELFWSSMPIETIRYNKVDEPGPNSHESAPSFVMFHCRLRCPIFYFVFGKIQIQALSSIFFILGPVMPNVSASIH